MSETALFHDNSKCTETKVDTGANNIAASNHETVKPFFSSPEASISNTSFLVSVAKKKIANKKGCIYKCLKKTDRNNSTQKKGSTSMKMKNNSCGALTKRGMWPPLAMLNMTQTGWCQIRYKRLRCQTRN